MIRIAFITTLILILFLVALVGVALFGARISDSWHWRALGIPGEARRAVRDALCWAMVSAAAVYIIITIVS